VADQTEEQKGAQTAQISGTVKIEPQGGSGAAKPDDKKPTEDKEAPEKKSRRRLIIIAVVAVLAILAGLYYFHSLKYEDTDDAQVDGDIYHVSARVAGQVTAVYVQEEQSVKAGQIIAQIDPRDYQVALDQAKANLANAQAEAEQANVNVPITSVNVSTSISTSGSDVLGSEASVQQAQSQVSAAEARVQQAQANALKAQIDVDRYTPLVAKDVISKQQFDQAVATAAGDKAALVEAQRNVKAQQDMVKLQQQRLAMSRSQAAQSQKTGTEQVKVQQARADAAKASVEQAQARVQQAQLNLSYTNIVAPIDGIISKKNVDVGGNLSVGQDLLTVVPLNDLWVTANFKETQLSEMKPGQAVELKVDALGGKKFEGYVQQIGGATGSMLSLFPPENATGNYVKVVQRIPVRINFKNLAEENKDHLLRPGMSVTPTVTVKQ
jgi:membrane fusion protein (multidrug efflux system)